MLFKRETGFRLELLNIQRPPHRNDRTTMDLCRPGLSTISPSSCANDSVISSSVNQRGEMPAVARLDSPAQRTETGTMAPGKEHRGQLGFFDAPESLRVRAVGKKVDATRKRKIRDSLQSERKLKATPEALPDKSVDKSAGEAHKENNMDDSASAATRKLCRAGSAAAAPDAVSTATAIATKEKPIPRFQGRPLAPPRNIVHQLDQRRIGQWKGKVTPSRMPWTTASWLKLQCPRSGRPLTGACLLEWDPMGVLLAIMTQQDGILRIYDWDTVSASDAKGRNHRLRRKTNPDQKYTGGSYRIDSTLQINVRIAGQDVRKLVWNPFDPDQIAILDRYVEIERSSGGRRMLFVLLILLFS